MEKEIIEFHGIKFRAEFNHDPGETLYPDESDFLEIDRIVFKGKDFLPFFEETNLILAFEEKLFEHLYNKEDE